MTDLAHERCVPCTGATPRIESEEARSLAADLDPDWRLTESTIERAFGLATRVALLAEAEGHHPDLEVGWGRLVVRLTTHAIGGLSRNDFVLAAKIDRITAAGPKGSGPPG
jgi:4a-hydroxytetrahydrobiopterin dehydratase